MKIALIGFGAMGRLVESLARDAGDECPLVMTSRETAGDRNQLLARLEQCDVAIDFSVPEAVQKNVEICMQASVPIVEGTTGWSRDESEIKTFVKDHEGAMVYGSNFSIGVNIFYRLIREAASMFSVIDGYAPFIEEAHHARKRDAPSGTALRIKELMKAHYVDDIPTSSTRAGFIPGTHRVGFDSTTDQILLTHTARSRQGFAGGAFLAARWIRGKRGVYEFSEVMEEVLSHTDRNNDGGAK